ncbi:STAS domain-containing protein [Krasilnikovia cinnamomea]|nr:STAS domain-containing protein [Krasilnikovia cinnamomea]
MDVSTLEVRTEPDGTVVIRPRGVVGEADVVHLQQVLVRTVRKVRPSRLVLDLTDVFRLDPIAAGTMSAVCGLGDDHGVAVFVHNPSEHIADQLSTAGVPVQRLRRTAAMA